MQSIRMTCQLNCTEFSIYIFTIFYFPSRFSSFFFVVSIDSFPFLFRLRWVSFARFSHRFSAVFFLQCVSQFLIEKEVVITKHKMKSMEIWWMKNEEVCVFRASFVAIFWSPSLSLSWLVVRKILINQLANLGILNEMSFIIVIAHFW